MKEQYLKNIRKKILVIGILIILLLIISIFSLMIGSSKLSLIETLKGIFLIAEEKTILIIYKIRMPRIISAILAGIGLSISGCIMQSILQNPIASPSTLGLTNASVFGANFAIIVLGAGSLAGTDSTLAINNPYLITICAFLFALISIVLILLLSKLKGLNKEVIILLGVALGMFFQAATTIIQYFSTSNQVAEAIYWSFGNLSRATSKTNLITFLVTLPIVIYFLITSRFYNVLNNGKTVAKTQGLNINLIIVISLILISILTATITSFLGLIGFIGLIAPQIMRKIIGDDYRFLIPSSALCGAVMILFADTLSRTILNGISLPVGAITSLICGPLFIYLLLKNKEQLDD